MRSKDRTKQLSSHLRHLGSVPLLESSLGLHEGGVLVPGVVMREVRVGCGTLGRGGGGRGRGGGCGGGLWGRYSGGFLLREVDGNLNISQRILIKYL